MSKEQNRRMVFNRITLIFSLIIFFFSSSQILTAQKKQASPKMDYTKAPTYGEVTLDNAFGDAPHSLTITSGGEVNSSYQDGCSGWVSEGPDFRLQWSGTTTQLAFFFNPNDTGNDATILVNTPDGSWICNDDVSTDNINPLALVTNPEHGQYDIWVGSYEEGKYIEGTLMIADLDKFNSEDTEVATLDYSLEPQYSSFNLKAGFSPDPYSISGTSGGDVNVQSQSIGGSCIGYASKAPDFRLNWTGSTTGLKIRFEVNNAGDDTILIINTPNGSWLCNDDENDGTLNPMIDLSGQEEGQFDIWVASLSSGEYHEGKLIITEL